MVDDELEVSAVTQGHVRNEGLRFDLRRYSESEPSFEEASAASAIYRRAIDAVLSQAARGAHQASMLVFLDSGLGSSAAHVWEAHRMWEAHSTRVLDLWRTSSRERSLAPLSAQPIRELALRVAFEERVLLQCVAALGRLGKRVDEISRSLHDEDSERRPMANLSPMDESPQLADPEHSIPTTRPLHVDDQGFITSGAVYGEQSFNRSSVRARAMVVNVEERDSSVASGDYPVPKLIDLSKGGAP